MLRCSTWRAVNGKQGYALLSILLVIVALFSGWLGMVIYQQAKSFQQQDELMIETLHQARLSALNYYQQHQNWPLMVLPDAIYNYVSGFEIIVYPSPRIRVQLANNALLQRIQGRLAASTIVDDWLVLDLVTEPLGGAEQNIHPNQAWLVRTDSAFGMATDLNMGTYSLHDAAEIEAKIVDFGSADSEYGGFAELSTEIANVDTLYSTWTHAGMLQTGPLAATSAHFKSGLHQHVTVLDGAQFGSVNAGAFDTHNVNSGSIISAAVDSDGVQSTQLAGHSLGASSIFSQYLQAPELFSGSVNTNQVSSQQTSAVNVYAQQTHAQNANVAETVAGHVMVNQAVHLSAQDSAPIMQLQEQLQILFNNLQNCMYSSRWCEAINPTAFGLHSCSGCNQQQTQAQFSAHLDLRGEECVHGCDITMLFNNMANVSWMCSPSSIARVNPFATGCTISKTLAENETWQQAVSIRAHNKKSPNVYSESIVFINWQRQPAFCPEFTIAEWVVGAEPANQELLVFPQTPLQEQAQLSLQRPDCNQNYPSELVCNGSATCASNGEWQNVSTSCTCVRTF